MIQFVLNGVCAGSVYAIVALGFGLIFFAARTFHIAHGAVYVVGGYACYGLLVCLKWPLPLAASGAIAAGVVVGVLTEWVVYRPLRDLRQFPAASSMAVMVSSLGIYVVLVNLVAIFFGNDTKILRAGPHATLSIATSTLTVIQVGQLVSGLLVVTVVGLFLKLTPLGRSFRALADDPELTGILGYDVQMLRLVVFGAGSALAATGGLLAALDLGITPSGGFDAFLFAAVAVILAGMGRFLAPAMGAILLGILQGLVVWRTSSKWASAVVFLVLIVLLIFRPQGLFGFVKRAEET
jgi:branched-chain amino acid transport system permease protein